MQVYDEADGELLILGEPGAGKTTLLLELARTLLDRAEADARKHLPVIFNLSSWAEKCLPLSDWLVEELRTKYQIPRTLGNSWVTTGQILPLLDGLDEVAENVRTRCVQVINSYYQQCLEEKPVPLVVCCRSQEYMAQPTRVSLHQAVSIQPLTDRQIVHYLQSAGYHLEALRQALRNDPTLYELAHRPLMLSIFTLAYQGVTPGDLPTGGTSEGLQQQVFATYVERMLTRRGTSKRSSREQTLRWLMFLAAGMQQHHQTIFFLEQLQPDWLPQKQKILYQWSIGLVLGLCFMLVSGLFLGLIVGLVFGPLAGLIAGLPSKEIYPAETLIWSPKGLSNGLLAGLFFGSLLELVSGQLSELLIGLLAGLVFGLFLGLSGKQLTERLMLSPNEGIRRSRKNGLVTGLVFGLLAGLYLGLIHGPLTGLHFGLGTGLLIGLAFGLFFGLGAVLEHYTLRFWLWRANCLPRNVAVFLDEAAERLLLRKVGSGYIFIHRLLLDYFSGLETPPPPTKEATQTQQSATTP